MKYGLWVCLVLTVAAAIWLYPTLYPAQRVVRPVAGDEVTPKFRSADSWKAGEVGRLEIRLSAAGGAKADLLTDVEVPGELLPEVRVQFYRGEEELPEVSCKVERAC